MSRGHLRIPEPYRKAARLARKRGWRITAAGTGHLRWEPPEGRPFFTASSPGPGGVRDDLGKLRKAGLLTREREEKAA